MATLSKLRPKATTATPPVLPTATTATPPVPPTSLCQHLDEDHASCLEGGAEPVESEAAEVAEAEDTEAAEAEAVQIMYSNYVNCFLLP